MPVSPKYAIIERERRYLVGRLPSSVATTTEIVDRYVLHTRLRLREVRGSDGLVVRKLGHKVRLTDGPAEVACTNFYLSAEEWAVLAVLPAHVLRKMRHLVQRDGFLVAIDEHEDGTLVAEIDDGDHPWAAGLRTEAWQQFAYGVDAFRYLDAAHVARAGGRQRGHGVHQCRRGGAAGRDRVRNSGVRVYGSWDPTLTAEDALALALALTEAAVQVQHLDAQNGTGGLRAL